MAQNMQELTRRMKSIQSTEHITNAMRLVSASKYKKAKNVFDRISLQMDTVCGAIREVIAAAQLQEQGLLAAKAESDAVQGAAQPKDRGKTILIVISSSKGLCGGFNANLMKEALAAAEGRSKENVEVFAIGSKGRDFFKHNGYTIIGEYDASPEKISFADAKAIAEPIIESFESGKAERILLVHTKYVNSLKQETVCECLMPLDADALETRSGEKSESTAGNICGTELEFSPSPREVLEYMIPKYFELSLFEAIIESAACEHASRRTAMENATDNANEMLEKLSLTYNRARQAAITNEIIEIVSGSEQ